MKAVNVPCLSFLAFAAFATWEQSAFAEDAKSSMDGVGALSSAPTPSGAAAPTPPVPREPEGAAAPAGSLSSAQPPPPPPAAPSPAPLRYSLPWQLRPVLAANVVRAETSAAFYEDSNGGGGATVVTIVTGSYKIPSTGPATTGLAAIARLAVVGDDPAPANKARGAITVVNPLLGLAYAVKLDGGFRLNASFGATVPVGGGGGDTPSPGAMNSRVKGLNARAQLDNAIFAVNDLTLIPGFDAAYVNHGLTVQTEITLLHLMRVRGDAVQREASKTNLTMGLHVGYFLAPFLSIGTELRYQRWLNAPFAVEKDATEATRDNLTFAVGPRAHVKVGGVWLRPGIAYQRGLDKPLAASTPNYHIVQFDIPLFF